jgi:hypothetical protein
MTGLGEGLRPIGEVDAMLRQLLGLRSMSTPTVEHRSAPSPPGTVGAAVVGERDDEAAIKRAVQPPTMELLAAGIVTDGARRKLAATGRAIVTMARAVAPSIRRAAEAARDQLRTTEKEEEEPDSVDDPSDEERRELLARFEALERREQK